MTASEFNAIDPNSAADRPLSRSVIALPKNVTPHGLAAVETDRGYPGAQEAVARLYGAVMEQYA